MLLVTTLYRLGLDIASTRLVLTHGHEGGDPAGMVIQAFGKLMMGGNFIIGVIVFAILVIVNFVVITKGSSRIAEVAARFTLDSMPGKQMAIDADLSSGVIDDKEAKRRRKELEQESTFFGAMDGASKFVRGDAMAGLIITIINVVGGMLIGVLQHHVSFGTAASTYTVLSIGEGLVSQIPALVISIAAGLLVSKAGVEGAADKAIVLQLATNPVALGMVSATGGRHRHRARHANRPLRRHRHRRGLPGVPQRPPPAPAHRSTNRRSGRAPEPSRRRSPSPPPSPSTR